jgi:hypothetical protein
MVPVGGGCDTGGPAITDIKSRPSSDSSPGEALALRLGDEVPEAVWENRLMIWLKRDIVIPLSLKVGKLLILVFRDSGGPLVGSAVALSLYSTEKKTRLANLG